MNRDFPIKRTPLSLLREKSCSLTRYCKNDIVTFRSPEKQRRRPARAVDEAFHQKPATPSLCFDSTTSNGPLKTILIREKEKPPLHPNVGRSFDHLHHQKRQTSKNALAVITPLHPKAWEISRPLEYQQNSPSTSSKRQVFIGNKSTESETPQVRPFQKPAQPV